MKDNYDFSQGKRGAVLPIPSHQTKITILIDNDILEWLGEQIDQTEGGDYVTLINQALRDYKQKKQVQGNQSNGAEQNKRVLFP